MTADDALYRTFLEELRALAEFRLDYTLDHPASGLEWEDPDVKRLIEALAFFGARTQLVALRNVDATRRRLYQQFFPYLLSPLSAMAMAQAKPNGQLAETLSLPADSELLLQPERGGSVLFRTLKPLRVLPLRLGMIAQEPLTGNGTRLLLGFQAAYPLNEPPGSLDLHINYLNDFAISLKVFNYLKRCLRRASVQYGEYDADQPGLDCPFRLGVPAAGVEADEWRHPLEEERYYFHFPQQELYLELQVPEPPRNWSGFTVALDCDQPWPRQLHLNRELFQLFTSPVVNSQRAFAQPIVCDGTRERYTIRHPQADFGFSLQQVLGVYEVTEQGLRPLRPGILAGGDGSYEVEQGPPREEGGFLHWLVPHFPSAFGQARTLAVEALWLQGWYDREAPNRHSLRMFRRQTQGVNWELLDTPVPHAENRELDNTPGFLHLLTLMHKDCLSGRDLRDLLLALGSVSSGRFQGVFRSLEDARLEEEPLGGREGRMTKQIYHLRFKGQAEENADLTEAFVQHVGRVLDLWIAGALVEARIEAEGGADGADPGVSQ
jgi:type VI secretion system protein ImpG